ncbi:MAG TPA: DUF4199 domain-containing protein [Chitinophagaceae bacterium]
MRKLTTEIKWALVFALVTLAWMVGEKLTGLHSTHIDKHATYTNFFALPAIALYVLALLDKRRNDYGGAMTWKQGFISGLFITLFVTILSPLTQVITSLLITPEFFPNAIAHAVSTGQMTQAEAEGHFNLAAYIKMGFIGAPVMGLVTSALVALFTRKRRPETREGRVDVVFAEGPKKPAN